MVLHSASKILGELCISSHLYGNGIADYFLIFTAGNVC
jgi:hypothetical protein